PRGTAGGLTAGSGGGAADKRAQIEKIKKDYEEMAARFAADFTAAGKKFPGGLNAYLRQLALLEREKRRDFAALLTPAELEDLEMQDTLAGKAVDKWLGDTAATEEQRRLVFRQMREFDEKYALTFDLTPPALLARETERQALQERIIGLLGGDLAASWLRGEGPDYASLAAFVGQQGLRPESALELWRIKNQLTLRLLAIAATPDQPAEAVAVQRAAAADWARTAAAGVIGQPAVDAAGPDVLGWIPPRR